MEGYKGKVLSRPSPNIVKNNAKMYHYIKLLKTELASQDEDHLIDKQWDISYQISSCHIFIMFHQIFFNFLLPNLDLPWNFGDT